MKLFVYAMRAFDELDYFKELCAQHQVELGWTEQYLTSQTVHLSQGADVVTVTPVTIDRSIISALKQSGVKAIATRSIGLDHVDLDACRELGLGVSHTMYEPNSVASYTVMMILMSLRRMPQIMARAAVQDYSLEGKLGRELSHLTVGVVGTGSIGGMVIDQLSGFGCTILGYDPYPRQSVAAKATYVELPELLQRSDVITLHAPLTPENHHMIDAAALARMKDDAVLVNTGRGGLIDTAALIETLEAGRLQNVALDVLEHEDGLYYNNRMGDVINNRDLAILRSFPNVLLTPHAAFYTDVDVYQMAQMVVEGAVAMMAGEKTALVVLPVS